MINNDELENDKDIGSEHERGSSNDDIPRWLQGFKDSEPDDTQPIAQVENSADAWVPEMGEHEIGPVGEDEIEANDDSALSDSESIDHPIEEISEETQSLDDLEQQPDGHISDVDDLVDLPDDISINDEIEIGNMLEEEMPQAINPSEDDLPSPEGFVDISGLDVSELPERPILDDEPLRQGDLPEWLQEMITEAEEPQPDILSSAAIGDQDLADEPMEITINLPDDQVEPLQDESVLEEGQTDFLMPESQAEFDNEITVTAAKEKEEEETSPLLMPTEEDDHLLTEVGPSFDYSPIYKEDHRIARIKGFLDDGNFDEAAPFISSLLEEESHLDELELWLMETVENDREASSQVFEVLGDIAFKQNKPADAFNAYTKAIKQLLVNDEVFDEIG